MLLHVTITEERVAEVLKKLFTIIVTNIFIQNLHDRHLFYSITSLIFIQLTLIAMNFL